MEASKRFSKLSHFLFLMMVILLPIGCSNANSNIASPQPSLIPITPVNEAGTIKVDKARLRVLPDVTSQQVGTLNRGNKVMVIGSSSDGNWYLVKATGLQKEAWIAVEFVALGTLPPAKTATESGSTKSSPATSSEIVSTFTATPTSTASATARSNATATHKPRNTSTPTSTQLAIATPTPTSTPTLVQVDTPTNTPTEPSTPTPTDMPTPTDTQSYP